MARFEAVVGRGPEAATVPHQPLQVAIARCYTELDVLDEMVGFGGVDSAFYRYTGRVDTLVRRLNASSLEESTFAEELRHDVSSVNTPTQSQLSRGVASDAFLRAALQANRHFVRSIEQLVTGVDIRPVDLQGLFGTATQIMEGIQRDTTVSTRVEGNADTVVSQEDLLFRILQNLGRNGQKGIDRVRRYQPEHQGRVEFAACRDGSEVVLSARDNGIGFLPYFVQIGFETSEHFINLQCLLGFLDGKGISGFALAGGQGTGKGLIIIEHFARLIGAQIFVEHPERTDGASVHVRMPSLV